MMVIAIVLIVWVTVCYALLAGGLFSVLEYKHTSEGER